MDGHGREKPKTADGPSMCSGSRSRLDRGGGGTCLLANKPTITSRALRHDAKGEGGGRSPLGANHAFSSPRAKHSSDCHSGEKSDRDELSRNNGRRSSLNGRCQKVEAA